MSLRDIGRSLSGEKLAPPRGKRWYASTIADLISKNTISDKLKSIQLATKLRTGGMSLRKIGEQLLINGLTPPKGGYWHAEQVNKLLIDAQLAELSDALVDVLGSDPEAPVLSDEDAPPPARTERPTPAPRRSDRAHSGRQP